jgi:hypothetical protein
VPDRRCQLARGGSRGRFPHRFGRRVNIEASAALAEWVDLYRADPGGRRYERLVNRAVVYLPMPKKTAKLELTTFGALAQPELAARILESADTTKVERVRGDAERHPSRQFANALLNVAWRNGPVENIHAGKFRGYPLDQRRMTRAEERKLMAFATGRLALGMTVCLKFDVLLRCTDTAPVTPASAEVGRQVDSRFA